MKRNKLIIKGSITLLLALTLWGCGLLSPKTEPSKAPSRGTAASHHQLLFIAASGSTSTEGAVYTFAFNPQTLKAEHTGTLYSPSPTFLAIEPNHTRLYITNNLSPSSMLSVALVQPNSGELTMEQQLYTLGEKPAHLSLHNGKIVVSNHGTGSITLFKAEKGNNTTTLLSESHWRINLAPEGATSQPRAAVFAPKGNHLYVPDMAQGKVFHFRVHDTNPPLTIDRAQTDLPNGATPGRMVFDKAGKYAYIIDHQKPTLYVLQAEANGLLTLLQEVKIPIASTSKGAHIALSPCGKYLYTSHAKGQDGIALFNIDTHTGKAKYHSFCKTGKTPRHFAISPCGSYIAVAVRDSNQVEFYKRNAHDGTLASMGYVIKTEQPMALLWEAF